MSILDYIFPKSCLECGKSGNYICHLCFSKIQAPKSICPQCKKPSIDGFTHTKCLRKLSLNGLICLWNYRGVIRKAILSFKYKYANEIAKEIAGFVINELQSKQLVLNSNVVITPIPMHWYKENYRGFNQSSELGNLISKKMNWGFVPDLLTRKKSTTPQVGLKGKERVENVKGAFSINSKFVKNKLIENKQNISLVVFDDVYTTGSTMKESVKVLKRYGFNNVWGLTLAR